MSSYFKINQLVINLKKGNKIETMLPPPLLTELPTDPSVHIIISADGNLLIVSNVFFRFSCTLSETFVGVSKCRLNNTFSVDCHGGMDVVMSNGLRFL